jgi:UDP-3-O-[3-hydroxymyristoyl] glucosamine N-acyltransferase
MKIKTINLADITEMVGGELVGDGSVIINNLASLDAAGVEDLTFLVKNSESDRLEQSKAGAALVPASFSRTSAIPVIKVKDPYLASAIVHNHLLKKPFHAKGIHPRAFIGNDCQISAEVTIGPLAAIGDRVRIGSGVTIEPGTVIGDDVSIGDETYLKANVTIAEGCTLGNRVVIHSGTVIGSDGYGYATDAMGFHVKRPQVGNVRIDDDVEIGSNVSIDRGAFGDTWIQSGVKIDNQVQIGHNVVVGPNSLIVAQVGIAGSTTLGRNVVLAGKVAVNGHIHLEDQVMVAAGSGIHSSLPKGSRVAGFPAIPLKSWAKSTTIFAKLPELYSELKQIRKTVSDLQANMQEKVQSTSEK